MKKYEVKAKNNRFILLQSDIDSKLYFILIVNLCYY